MPDVLVAGATGLIGSEFLQLIRNSENYPEVIAVARRAIPSVNNTANITQRIIDFDKLEDYIDALAATTTVCALGTTIKKAGSQEKFREVDYLLPLKIAKIVLENGGENFVLVSAVGADPDSKVFYNRVKGELEADIRKLPFKSIHILRPSLLLGEREEFRAAEALGQMFLKPIRKIFPLKYRPIYAMEVAQKILEILSLKNEGIKIYEGAELHSPIK